MTQEEKAKAYDIALDKIKRLLGTGSNCSREDLEYVFPELVGSEDEKIRKHLIGVVELYYGNTDEQEKKDCLAWLEKQGEDNKKEYSVWVGGGEINDYYLSKEEAEKLAEEYKKDGYDDVIVEKQENNNLDNFKGSQREQVAKAKESLLNDKSEELSQPEVTKTSEQVWSEEDDRMCNRIVSFIPQHLTAESYTACINWLKSLKDRYTWKPNDEQMDALRYVTNFDYGGHKATLVSLYEQLKKL